MNLTEYIHLKDIHSKTCVSCSLAYQPIAFVVVHVVAKSQIFKPPN